MPKDFLGQELRVGDFVAYPGGGNTSAEYGLLLMRVEEVRSDAVKVERLDCQYKPNKVNRKYSTIKALTKLVKVTPPLRMVEVFNEPDKHFDLVSKWVHGRTDIDWQTLKVGKMRD